MHKQIAGRVPVLPTSDEVVAGAKDFDSAETPPSDREKPIIIATDPSDVASLSNN